MQVECPAPNAKGVGIAAKEAGALAQAVGVDARGVGSRTPKGSGVARSKGVGSRFSGRTRMRVRPGNDSRPALLSYFPVRANRKTPFPSGWWVMK